MYYPAYTPNPNSPLEQRYGQDDSALGFFASLGAQGARGILADPAVEARLQEFQAECKVQAREGVKEWMRDNYAPIVLTGIGLVLLNWVILSAAVLPYVGNRARR